MQLLAVSLVIAIVGFVCGVVGWLATSPFMGVGIMAGSWAVAAFIASWGLPEAEQQRSANQAGQLLGSVFAMAFVTHFVVAWTKNAYAASPLKPFTELQVAKLSQAAIANRWLNGDDPDSKVKTVHKFIAVERLNDVRGRAYRQGDEAEFWGAAYEGLGTLRAQGELQQAAVSRARDAMEQGYWFPGRPGAQGPNRPSTR